MNARSTSEEASPASSRTLGSLGIWWDQLPRDRIGLIIAILVVNACALTAATWQVGRLAASATWAGVAVYAALMLTRTFTWVGAVWCWRPLINQAAGTIRGRLLGRALRQPLTVLGETSAGELVDRIDDNTSTVARTLADPALQTVSALLTATAAILFATSATPWAVPGFTIVLVVVAWVTRALGRQASAARADLEEAWTDAAIVVDEAVLARDDVRALSGRAHALGRFSNAMQRVLGLSRRDAHAKAVLSLVIDGVLAGSVCITLVAAALAQHAGALSLTQMVALVSLAVTFSGQVRMVTRNYPVIIEALGAAQKVAELDAVAIEEPHADEILLGPATVEFRACTFSYGPHLPHALRGVDLTVTAGRTCGVVGRTGAGKSTLVSLLTRAAATPPGMVFINGRDVCDFDPDALRRSVAVVSQRTELLAASVTDNVTLFDASLTRANVHEAFESLGLADWVASLPDGLDTQVGAGGLTLSSGEEQLVAFARVLVREPAVVVLDEATARMDPVTDARVARAAARLLAGRTGIVIAHRLATLRSCYDVAVIDHGRVVDHGDRHELLFRAGPFADLVRASRLDPNWLASDEDLWSEHAPTRLRHRREQTQSVDEVVGAPQSERWRPQLARTVWNLMCTDRRNGLGALAWFGLSLVLGYGGVIGTSLWGRVANQAAAGNLATVAIVTFVAFALLGVAARFPADAMYPRWWTQAEGRLRAAILSGQLDRYRVRRRPAGEVVSRIYSASRVVTLGDRWADLMTYMVLDYLPTVVVFGVVPGAILFASGLAPMAVAFCTRHRIVAWARRSAERRAHSAVFLASIVDAARTVKLFAAGDAVTRAYRKLDHARVEAERAEGLGRATLEQSVGLSNSLALIATWAAHVGGVFPMPVALAASAMLLQSSYAGYCAFMVVVEGADARYWLSQVAPLAQSEDLVSLPPEVSFAEPPPAPRSIPAAVALDRLQLDAFTVVHDDGTVGVADVNLTVRPGELVLVVGEIGSGKSSLLGALAGLYGHCGALYWNERLIEDPEVFLRPGQVAWVGQVPRVLSGTFADNVTLGHERDLGMAVNAACLRSDIDRAGGHDAAIGHRGVRLSGGQVQRLALARALAARTELLIADDVSSALDAETELDVWASLREHGCAVVAASCKRSALQLADRVIVLDDGLQVASGRWDDLEDRYAHLGA
ncbi:MAG: ATP-binding cassette domain-containing protein [Acidimicrobiia bacterium]